MKLRVYINAKGSKFKDSTGSRPAVLTVSNNDYSDKENELQLTGMTKEEKLESLQLYVIDSMQKGLIAGGAGKYIDPPIDVVIENDNIVIKNIPEADVKPDVRINASGLNPYETGKIIAENKIRGLDSDPSMRGKKFENEIWDAAAVERIRTWVVDKKLPNNPVEWQYINRLRGDDRERELNKIVNAIIYNRYSGIHVKNKMKNTDKRTEFRRFEKTLNEFADERRYEQTINAARRMNFRP
jgi:hypothetical protein